MPNKRNLWLFAGFGLLTLACVLIGAWLELPYLAGIPLVGVTAYLVFVDFKALFYLLLFLLPLSFELHFPNGLSTDMPTEPLMILLTVIFFLYIARRRKEWDWSFFKDPLIQLILLNFVWLGVAVIYSSIYSISIKFLLAKTWYIVTFVFLAHLIVKDQNEIKKVFWVIFLPLLFTVIWTIINHWTMDFAFNVINRPAKPFFRNHVNYAAMVVIFIPLILTARRWYSRGTVVRAFLTWSVLIFLVGIYFSYTRAAWLALILAIGAYYVIKYNFMRTAVLASIIALFGAIYWLVDENNYLRFSTDYQKTIIHDELEDHLVATYKMEDLSSMERIYRWVAAARMSTAKPITGFGPGNFYHHYRQFEVSSFTTYVSDNLERSGVHNYLLMVLVEQGYIGLSLFLILTFAIFLYGQRVYNESKDPQTKALVMGLLTSLVCIYTMNFLSDLIEVDKVGTLYFLNIALLVGVHLRNKRAAKQIDNSAT
jgi:O-antigen ligase